MLKTGLEIADRYTLTRRLGGSEQVQVWEAADRRTDARVVLKLQPRGTSSPGLEAEYSARAALDHPAIMRPLELVNSPEYIGIVMPLAPGGDLGSLRGRSLGMYLAHLRSVAQALAYLHARALVFGDLKASNVLIDAGGRAQLADFGNLTPAGAGRGANLPLSPYSAGPQQRAAQPAQPSDDIYSFGALLCEMLSGQPPNYGSADAGASELPANWRPVGPAPQRLIELMQRCLKSKASDRPASMQEIDNELATISADAVSGTAIPHAAPALAPPKSAAEVLRPTWKRSAPVALPDPKQLQRQGFRSGVVVAVIAALGLVAIALFVVPIHRPATPVVPAAAVPAAASEAAKADSESKPVDLQALAELKSTADEQRASIAERLANLKKAGAESWAAAGTAAAVTALAAADNLMQQHDYAAAQTRLSALAHDLTLLEAQRAPAYKSLMQQGEAGLQQGDAKAATTAFNQALVIRPGDASAQRGAKRAASLDAVFAQNTAARQLEQQGRIAEAAAAYRKTLSLDPYDPQAQSGLARTGAQVQADQFGRAMSRAYAAIASQQEAAARAAIEEARRIRPNDPEIARATAQLAAMSSATQLTAALARAHAAESTEQWQEAASQYQRALSLDSTLVDARRAMQVASDRARLNADLEQVISHPERTYSQAVYVAARASLDQAKSIASPGPVLSRQIGQVSSVLDQASTPVSVTLRSDNLTAVTVYRVGELGNFTERALQLKPGRYVVVGTRSGYRDVRRELNVAPGAAPAVLSIQCVDPI
jgi:hypothetical protein